MATEYTEQLAHSFSLLPETRGLVVEANGGAVVIEAWTGGRWVQTDTKSQNGADRLYTSGLRLRFTPSDGAVFGIDTTTEGM